MSIDSWVEHHITAAQPLAAKPIERKLIEILIHHALMQPAKGEALAAAFDLLISAEYYAGVNEDGWLTCHQPRGGMYYPFTNVCPACLFDNQFDYHPANKPRSGVIGTVTARLLSLFLQQLVTQLGCLVEIRKGTEPVDLVAIDTSTHPPRILFAEIKAAPLLTLPLARKSKTKFYATDIDVMLPDANAGSWDFSHVFLGRKANATDRTWAYSGLVTLLADEGFFGAYLQFWQAAFHAYAHRQISPIYWLTNGCGQPIPRPADWPSRRGGGGYETVSDSKTSVGLDRTDDIKKAIYQVLRLGISCKPSPNYQTYVGIVSNIHAARHYETYLAPLMDMVWTSSNTAAEYVADLDPRQPVHHLVDALIAFTETTSHSPWVLGCFRFAEEINP